MAWFILKHIFSTIISFLHITRLTASREKGEKLAKQFVDSIVEIGRLELGW